MPRTTVITAAALAIGAATALVPTAAEASPASHAPRCAESQLHASIDPRHIPGNGTTGPDGRLRHAVLLDFENTSRHTCTLRGYPGAAILDYHGNQVKQARRTTAGTYGGHKVRTVTLRPKHYAAAFLEGKKSTKPGNCGEHFPAILVTPPNTAHAVRFTVKWPKCFSFVVHPVRRLASRP